MKILRLSLNNLASLAGTHHIHFDHQPLAHAGLIAITGKTGAGKSTLLDAMCLALYNEVPRLKGAAGSLKDTGGQDISIKDSKNILRRGTTSGFAELEFIALDSKRYQARWEIRRARNKVDGNLKVERAITCLDDQRVLNQKISEATPIIEKLIGLSFEQFTRAVLLAQSEVGAFLKAKDNERADLLEYLTNSHIFSLVSIKAAEKYSQVKQQRAELENMIGHIEILSPDDIEQLIQQQKQFGLTLQNLQQSEKLLENERKWHLDRHKMYADVHAKKEVYDVQLDAVTKSAPQQILLEQLDTFQSIREQFVQLAKLTPQKVQIQQQQSQFSQAFEALKTQAASEKSQFNALQHKLQQFSEHREVLKPHLELGLKLDHEINTVSEQYKKLNAEQINFQRDRLQPLEQNIQQQQLNLNHIRSKQQQLTQQLNETQAFSSFDQEPQSILQRLNDYAIQYQQLEQDNAEMLQLPLTEIQQRSQQHYSQIKELTEQYQSLAHLEQQLSTVQQQRQQQQSTQVKIEHIQQRLKQLVQQVQDQQKLQTEIQAQEQQLQQRQHAEQQLQQQLETQQKAFTQLETVLKEQRLLHTQSVQELRAQLKTDEPCMVCGSLDHPFITGHELLEQGLQQLQEQQLQQAKQKLEHLLEQKQQENIETSKQHAVLEQQQQRFNSQTADLTRQKNELLEQIKHFATDVNHQDLSVLATDIQRYHAQLNSQIQAALEQEQHLQQHLNQWRESQQQRHQLQLLQQQREQLEQLISPVVKRLPSQYQTVPPMTWLHQGKQQLAQRIQYLTEQKNIEHDLNTHQQSLEKSQYQLQLEQQNYADLNQKLQQLIQQGKDLRHQLAELTEHYAGKTYRIALDWQADLDQEHAALAQALEQQRQKAQQADAELHQANLKVQEFITRLHELEQQLNQAEQAIQSWQLTHPHVTQSMTEQWLAIDLAQHQQLRQDLMNQKQILENAKTAWQLLEEQYQAHLKQQPEHEFELIKQKLSDIHLEKTTQQDAYNELDAKLRINASNQATYAKYQTQIEQVKAEEYRWGRIYDLIGHKEGTKFQKIAQEHHLDILVEYANQQLQPLAPRYQLHRIPNSLSLAIIDLDMNSEIRPVLSLSGGETFLVSLALALAIANMASGSMKLESLFIDEGFGTLDPASLHMVMNALDHLQSQGRKVVLISHVQEMHERIPVQIQVKPVGAGASTIEVIG